MTDRGAMRLLVEGLSMRTLTAVTLVIALTLGSLSCVTRRTRGQAVTGLDPKLSMFAYIEEGDLVSFIVDARSTRYRENDAYIPLEICVANRGLRELRITRESFTLVDSAGNRYPCAGPQELLDRYEFLDLDRNLAELAEVVFSRFVNFTRYPSKFSPTRLGSANPFASNLVRDTVNLPKFGYLIDYIYFPRPETGVMNQKFELFLESPELPDPVFVKFMVK